MQIKRPIIRWHGGKWRLAPWIISNFKEHRIYTEAFGGGASVLLRKPRSYSEIYNDLDGEIVNVFNIVRDRGGELKRYLELTPFSRVTFKSAYNTSEDTLIKAAQTIIKSYMGFGSDSIRHVSGFRANSNRSGTTPAHDWVNYPLQILNFIERLRGVIIESRPAIDILNQHDSLNTLHYVDPPYVHSTRQSSKRYAFEMTDEQHVELSKTLKRLKGNVIISAYPSKLYNDLYSDWRKIKKVALADGAKKRIELLFLNF